MGIVVPFSWSFWGAVVEHAELQAAALRELGHDVRLVMGNDPPGQFTRVLHPRVGRHGQPPPEVIPIGRSVIVPANGSLPNIILSPRSIFRIRRVLARERFDVLHLHEPMTPTPCIAALALFDGPMVGTHHASGELGWMRLATPVWGFLEERLDRRIAVSEQARESAQRWLPGEYEIVPNGVLIPEGVEPGGREHRIVFAGRQEPRKGLQVLLRAWPEIRRRTGARLRIAGADPLAVRLLLTRLRVSDDGIDVLGFLSQDDLTAELASAKALVAPSLGGESFGMVLTRAFACATPVVASDIPGYRDVMTPETSVAVAPGDLDALADAVEALLADEAGRAARGAAARQLAIDRYSWQDIARRLERIYDSVARDERARAGGGMKYLPRSPWVAGVARPAAARRRRRAALVARARLERRLPRVRPRQLGLDRVRARAEPLLGAPALARLAADDQPGARAAAAALRPGLLRVLGRPARERGAARPDRRARARGRAAAPRSARPRLERRRSSGRSSRTGSSISPRRCS